MKVYEEQDSRKIQILVIVYIRNRDGSKPVGGVSGAWDVEGLTPITP